MPGWHNVGCLSSMLVYELGDRPGRPSARAYLCAGPDGLRVVGTAGTSTPRELALLEEIVDLDIEQRFAVTRYGGVSISESIKWFGIQPTTSVKHSRGRKTKWTPDRLLRFEERHGETGDTEGLGPRQTREVLRRARAIRAKPPKPVRSWEDAERDWFELRRRTEQLERNWQGRPHEPRRSLQVDAFRDSLADPGDERCGYAWKGLVCNLHAGHAGLHAQLAASVAASS